MAERRIVVDTLRLNYQGLVNITEFYRMLDSWFKQHGYEKYEKNVSEQVFKNTKQTEVIWEPWKKINDYAKIVIKMTILMTNIKEVVIKKDNKRVKTQQAKVLITFMGHLETDWEHKWEGNPVLYFLRAVFDQFVYKIHTDKYYSLVAEETDKMYAMMKAYLNLQRY